MFGVDMVLWEFVRQEMCGGCIVDVEEGKERVRYRGRGRGGMDCRLYLTLGGIGCVWLEPGALGD